jgi:hypothetical protein
MGSGQNPRATHTNIASGPAYASAGLVSRTGTPSRWRNLVWGGGRPGALSALLWLIPLAVAAVYVVVFVTQLPHNITALSWDSDYASEFTIPETLARAGTTGNIVMASAGQWVPLWFGLLTARLPLHRELWGIAPTLLFVTTALTVGWSVSQLAGRRAAILAVLMILIASPFALAFFMAPAHTTVYPCTALLGAYLIWLAQGRRRRRLPAVTVPPVVGVLVGTCVASDLLLAASALVPLTVTALLAGARRDRRSRLVALSALVTVAVAIPIAKVTSAIMHGLGFLTLATPAKMASLSELPQRALLLFKGLKGLFNGYLGPAWPGTLHSELGIASAIVMSAALLALLLIGTRTAATFVRSGLREHSAQTAAQLARSLHITYWVSSAVIVCGAFWLAAETGGGTNLHESYYGTVIFSVAAVVPLLLSANTLARRLIVAGVSVFFAASLVGLTSNYIPGSDWIARVAPTVTRIARANQVTAGYGGYGAASSLTWNTHGRLTVRPLMECSNPAGANVCPFYMAQVPSWYVPRQRHTFLLVDREEPWVSELPAGLGTPLASYAFGAMRMYIYPYDIASRLGPAQD